MIHLKLSWKRWLKPRYVWMRIKRRFGWRPEWEKKIMNQRLQPDRIIMSEDTYNDLVAWCDASEDLRCIRNGEDRVEPPPFVTIDPKKVRPE